MGTLSSDAQRFPDGLIGVRPEIDFPDLDKFDVSGFQQRAFPFIPTGSSNLARVFRTIRVDSWICVPKSPVHFDSDVFGGHEEIDNSAECPVWVSNPVLGHVVDSERVQHLSDFFLQMRNTWDTAFSDRFGGGQRKFLPRLGRHRVSSLCLSLRVHFAASFRGRLSHVKRYLVRFGHYPSNDPAPTSFVMTRSRTKKSVGFREPFLRRSSRHWGFTDRTRLRLRIGEDLSSTSVRTFSRARGLTAMFQPSRICLVRCPTHRAIPVN